MGEGKNYGYKLVKWTRDKEQREELEGREGANSGRDGHLFIGHTENTSSNRSEGFLRELGRNEMQSSYLHSRSKGLARIGSSCVTSQITAAKETTSNYGFVRPL